VKPAEEGNKEETCNRVREIRKTLRMTQAEFARRLGMRQTALSMIEGGNNRLSDKNVRLLCAEFSVAEQWVRTGEGEMFAPESPHKTEFLEIFSGLSRPNQEFLLEMARSLLKKQDAG
jgi:transcriptional regulator with XRE-family HTH domain